jgi:Mg/Co/Ni transporter MgtE
MMSRSVRGALYGVVAVLLLDTLGSLASRALAFNYGSLSAVSTVIYLAVGAYVGLGAPLSRAAGAAAVVGFVEATLGRAISWAIGPGRPEPGDPSGAAVIASAVVMVTLIAAAVGTIGGWLARRIRRPAAPAA